MNTDTLKAYIRELLAENLWDNIRKAKASGKKRNHPNSKAYKTAKKAGQKINKNEADGMKEVDQESTIKHNADPALRGDQTKLPDNLQKAIIDKASKSKKESHHERDESDAPHPKQYGAPQGSKRDDHLDYVKRLFKSADKLEAQGKKGEAKKKRQTAYDARTKEEKSHRKNEAVMPESKLRELIADILKEELSAKVKKSLDKKADKRGFTRGSVYKEFKKGLAAFATSGSRKGMSAHQWAHARVNSANPSKKWAVVKKSKAKKESEDAGSETLIEAFLYHLEANEGFDKNIFRPGSTMFFALFREARALYKEGLYTPKSHDEIELLIKSDIGEFGIYENQLVPLDYPIEGGNEEHLNEAEYKGKKVKLNKPIQGSPKAYVYVNSGKKNKDGTIRVKKVPFGSSMPDAMGDSEKHKKRRKSFGDRHNCADKDDKTAPGYWSCRATKFFGRDIAGWW